MEGRWPGGGAGWVPLGVWPACLSQEVGLADRQRSTGEMI